MFNMIGYAFNSGYFGTSEKIATVLFFLLRPLTETVTSRWSIAMAKKNFETSLEKLEQITDEIEEGELSLEESLKKFQEAINLVNFCNSKLEEARTKVDLLISQNDTLTTVPFNQKKDEH